VALKKKTTKKKILKKAASKKAAKKRVRVGRVLSPSEPPPYRIENAQGRGQGVIICDHASYRLPKSLKDMGLAKTDLKKHIAWDIGAEDISRYMSKMLDMPAVLATYSRLVVDLNRAPGYHECIPPVTGGIKVPANTNLSKEAKDRRLKEIFWPYQKKLGQVVDAQIKKKKVPFIIAVHSMTNFLEGQKRPWHISILWHKEEKIAKKLVSILRRNHPDFLIGENEPYTLFSERFSGSTMSRHVEELGLPYVFVEFRQDLVDTKEKALRWADIFLDALKPILENPEMYSDRRIKPRKK
jgi:predicted N-formylglutamate amidohydrolase